MLASQVSALIRRTAITVSLLFAMLGCSTATLAGPHTGELFNEAMRLAPKASQGGELYRQSCLECHGPTAFGDGEKAIPSLAGQSERYLIKQLVDFSELDRDAPEMHRLIARPQLAEPQAWRNLASYLEGLRPNPRPQVGSGRDLARGKSFYISYCATCHGKSAEGLDKAPVPALRGQHYSYLVLQLKSFDTGNRQGLAGPLVEHMIDLSVADREAVADYLSRLPALPRRETVSTRQPEVPPAG